MCLTDRDWLRLLLLLRVLTQEDRESTDELGAGKRAQNGPRERRNAAGPRVGGSALPLDPKGVGDEFP